MGGGSVASSKSHILALKKSSAVIVLVDFCITNKVLSTSCMVDRAAFKAETL